MARILAGIKGEKNFPNPKANPNAAPVRDVSALNAMYANTAALVVQGIIPAKIPNRATETILLFIFNHWCPVKNNRAEHFKEPPGMSTFELPQQKRKTWVKIQILADSLSLISC